MGGMGGIIYRVGQLGVNDQLVMARNVALRARKKGYCI